MSEAQVANLRHQLVAARADLEAKSGDLSLTSGEVDQLHAELEASAEQVERLESAKARMERDHKRALGEAKWDVNEAREQLRAANEKLQEALIEREVSQASTRDSASRLAAYLDEIERLERELGTLRGGMEDKANEEKGRDEVMERMREEMRALTEDKELLNIALESKTMEVALLQRQLPKQAQGAAKGGQTTPKRKLVASTSRLSMNGRGDVTPKASERLAKSALGTPSGSSRASLATSIGASRRVPPVSPTKMVKASRASTASIDDSSDTSFASARSPLANGPSALRGGLKGNRRESSVMGPPSHIPSLSGQARARQQSLGMGRASTATPSSGTAAAAAAGHYPSEPNRSTSAVLGDSTRQNRPASAMAVPVSPSKISTFARGPLPRSTGGMKDLVAVAEADMGSKAAGGAKGLRRMYSISSLSSIGSGGARNNAGGHLGI